VSSILGSINFIITILNYRRVSKSNTQLGLFVWALLVTTFLLVLSLPVLAGGLTILILDRNFNTSFFYVEGGGNVILFQHIF
jgi:heme/copper-type cytochrome/quinol oxidase subunit 1